jgi:hypothetical protein
MTKNLQKCTAVKLFLYFLDRKLQFTYLYLHKGRTLATGEAFSSKREHPTLQNMKILYFFRYLWVIFVLLDPDPDPSTQLMLESASYAWGACSAFLQ